MLTRPPDETKEERKKRLARERKRRQRARENEQEKEHLAFYRIRVSELLFDTMQRKWHWFSDAESTDDDIVAAAISANLEAAAKEE